MTDRYGDEWTAGLLDPGRRLGGLTARELLEDAGLRPGMTVVDYGCGPGLVTLQAAEAVGTAGKVYALDIHEGMVSLVGSRAAEAGLANLTVLLNDGPEAPLPDGVADVVTCTLVFHYKESRRERQALGRRLGSAAQTRRLRDDRPVDRRGAWRGDVRSSHGGRPGVRLAVPGC